jgi:PAS domain S-box-containing protein
MTSGQSIELARLGHAFNVMAETLQQQTNEQKQAAAALRSSEAMLNETGRIAKIGGWAIDLEKGTLTWTREVYAIHEVEDGFRPTVERAINFYAPESRPIIQQAVAQAIHSGEPFDVELEVITAKGRRIWVQAIGHVLLVSGKAQSISGTFQDITERKQAEAELARERTLLRTLLDLLPDSIYVKDRDSRFMAANAACARDMGAASGGDLIGKTDADFYPPEKASVFRSDELQVLAGKPVVDKEEVHVAPDGTRRILLTTKVPLQNSDGHIVGLVGTSRDITKHKQAEAERNELAQQRQLALNAARLGWWHYDPITKIATWDDRYKEIFGVTGHQRPNEEILARMHPDDLPGVWAKVEAALNPVDPKPYAAEYRMNLPGGVVHWVEAFGLAIFEGEGAQRHAVSFVGTVQDITERKQVDAALHRLNEELEQRIKERTVQLEAANKELEAFSYSVSHDLRAPLRAVDGFSHALAQDCGDRLDAEGQDFLKRIRAATKRMGQLIDDMLTLSRISRAALHKQPVDVSALARSVISELQEAEPQRKVDVQIAEKLQAEADPNLLRIALENLLGNAWKFTAKTPQPRIEVGQIADAPAAPGTTFFVRDNGAGFDMAYADKLFGAFQRLHRQDEFPGTGIGLATVMRIIHRHGGSVRAEGAVDRGATFFFTLDPLNHALPSSCVVGESRNHED